MPKFAPFVMEVGQAAPDFSLPSTSGDLFSLAAACMRGPVVAIFVKISCPTTQFTLPFIERLFKTYRSANIAFLAISQDRAEATREFFAELGVTFPLLLDDEDGYEVSNEYGLTNVPTFYLISQQRKVLVASAGFDKKAIESIGELLAEYSKRPLAPVFLPGEVVPENKPGCRSNN
jgi:peroxiredoxin